MAIAPSNIERNAEALAELRSAITVIGQQNHVYGRPADAVSGETLPDWLDQASGLFKNSDEFEQSVRSGEKWRNLDRQVTGE